MNLVITFFICEFVCLVYDHFVKITINFILLSSNVFINTIIFSLPL